MGIGDDLAQVFTEVGTACTIVKADLTEHDEYFDYEAFPDHSTVFIRQNCYAGTFAYDSVVFSGDIVLFNNEATLVMNRKEETFENEYVVQNAYLIQCNTRTGTISRKSSARGTDYKNVVTWTVAVSNIHALHYAATQDSEVVVVDNAVSLEKEQHTLYLSTNISVEKGDRWIPTSGADPYEIIAITDFRYDGLHVCTIQRDFRE